MSCISVTLTMFLNKNERQDSVVRMDVSVGVTACHFRAGDSVRLHVCSAAHPRWLRHPLQEEEEDWLLGASEVSLPHCTEVLLRLSVKINPERVKGPRCRSEVSEFLTQRHQLNNLGRATCDSHRLR